MVGGKKIFSKTKKFLQILVIKLHNGYGQITKARNQILVASTMIVVSETFTCSH